MRPNTVPLRARTAPTKSRRAERRQPPGDAAQKSRWARERRQLWLGTLLLKRFRQPAKNQETILDAFEEDGWPAHIDDPLPGRDNGDGNARKRF